MKSLKYYNPKFIIIIMILICQDLYSQNESKLSINQISMFSALCPGLGQVYNKKYWKIPIIYAALGGCAYYYNYNNNKYKKYKNEYIFETDNDDNTSNNSGYTASNLITLQDYYRNSRDLTSLLFVLVYILNIVDANVDAHLNNYNVNDNLSFYVKPIENEYIETINIGFTLNL